MNLIFKYYLLLIACFLVLPLCSSGQDFKDDYKKVLKAYRGHPDMYVEVNYHLYSGKDIKPLVSDKGVVKRKKDALYTSYFNYEMLETSSYRLTVDHKHKYLFLVNKEKKYVKQEQKDISRADPDFALKLIDSIAPMLKNVKYDGVVNHIKTYKVHMPGTSASLELSFNDSSYLLTRMVLWMDKEIKAGKDGSIKIVPTADIEYVLTDMHPVFAEKDFSLSRFVLKNKAKKYIASPAYHNYKLFYTDLGKKKKTKKK